MLIRAKRETNVSNKHKVLEKSLLAGGRSVGYLHSAAKELNSGQPRKNPVSNRVEGLNPGPADYKSSTLTTQPCCLYTFKK